MRLLGLDLETTGLDTANDRITELGYVLWEVETKKPIALRCDYLHSQEYPKLSDEIVRLTGITDEILSEFGVLPGAALEELVFFAGEHKVDYIVAHGGENFDRPLLYAELTRHNLAAESFRKIGWIDTKTDIPFEKEPESRRLKHLATDHGFLNPFAHRAIFDVLTMLRVLSHHPIDKVIEFQKIPFVTMRAMVDYDHRELAKAQRFSWEKIGEKVYPRWWVKRIKENLLELETEACKKAGFELVRID